MGRQGKFAGHGSMTRYQDYATRNFMRSDLFGNSMADSRIALKQKNIGMDNGR
jgi:hypothetical protein